MLNAFGQTALFWGGNKKKYFGVNILRQRNIKHGGHMELNIRNKGKDKSKVNPRTGHEDPERGSRVIALLFP